MKNTVEIHYSGRRIAVPSPFQCGLFAVTERYTDVGTGRRERFYVTHMPTGYRMTRTHRKHEAIRICRAADRLLGRFKALKKDDPDCVKATNSSALKAAVKRFKKVRGYEYTL